MNIRSSRVRQAAFSLIGVLCCAGVAVAKVSLPPFISSHMVLQRDAPCPIWGHAAPGEEVTVAFAGQTQKAKADADGKWLVKLKPMPANAQPQTLIVTGRNTIRLDDVLVGEVWLCSGQSNMVWTVNASANGKEEAAAANHPRLRQVKISMRLAASPQADAQSSGWQVCSPQSAGDFTAVGYYFGRQIMTDLDMPVGLISSNVGATRIEPWTPREGFQQVPALKSLADKPVVAAKKGNGNGKGKNKKRRGKNGKNGKDVNLASPMGLYNGMIHPLVPYAIRGVLWYQGESNNGEGMLYLEKMKALIGGWRAVWNQPEMPFLFVQLAPFNYGQKDAAERQRLPGMWEAQTAALSIPNTGMAATVDIGEPGNIHPMNKQDVGRRLALWAMAKVYGKPDIVYSGPTFKSMQIDGAKIRLSFDHVGGGLMSRDGKPLSWFTVAGEDKKFVDAQAEIDGATVVVSAESVSNPVAVRFGWDQTAQPNLSNKEGLPALPFRTDK